MRSSLFTSSFKTVGKRVLAIGLLMVCTLTIFGRYSQIAQPLNGNFHTFNRIIDEETVDVLCVGSSHVYCGINPVQMWDDHGIAAYDLAEGSQAIWHSYYYIKEALKTQTPRVVVLDVYTAAKSVEEMTKRVKSNLINMPWSYDKWEALTVADTEEKMDIFWNFPAFHTRYDSLSRSDYDLAYEGDLYLGYIYHPEVVAYEAEEITDVRHVQECEPIPEKAEEYLRKSIELCQDNNIDIVLTNTPWPNITEDKQKYYNYVQGIADEYGVPFINGCLLNDEIGMDYSVDSMGNGGHLNYSGVTKYTRWFTEWLVERYELPDRRSDAKWDEWQRQSDRLKAVILKNELSQADNLAEYLNCIGGQEHIYYAVSLNGFFDKDGTQRDSAMNALSAAGISLDHRGVYVRGPEGQISGSAEDDYNWWYYFDDSVLHVFKREDYYGGDPVIRWNNESGIIVGNGINILVYDDLLKRVVSQAGFNADNNYEIIRQDKE